ncbi:bifunctional oligoribonuclease/PAP phosphatase NrnA [Bacillus carboniphilus]|uniref:Bifunctional oligoribonuclease/PAP phosphatase NrnA n=1 Tax=Bacillus carboniphilus TaxID=86663 RepID=A0ABY9JZH6_9BACI|nr:bifunctional oligoribonuclease/PAP phosphatase NrnA [Bacillus carboniphilus]WLR44174.1 bifunctional oligoribonuclease/PAP phosphatase NrnA [Bacillus carboniphilus]
MKQKILEEIQKHNTIIIHRHVRPDPDAYGSQCGLAEILRESFPDKNVFVVGEEDPSLTFMASMEVIEDSTYEGSLVIVCDTANKERISDQRYNQGNQLIKIDHHPNEDPYASIEWVDSSASSVSEMIYEFYLFGKTKGLKMNNTAAELIYLGIVGDTGRFLFPSTSPKTFQYASDLLKWEISLAELYQGLYKIKPAVAKLSGVVLQTFEQLPSGAAFVKLTKETLERYGVSVQETSQLVGTLGHIEGIKAWIFFVEEENQIRVRLRSKGPVINELAKRYNGGGHPMASGATIKKWGEADHVVAELDKICSGS